jgi:YbbR domain-containing protein
MSNRSTAGNGFLNWFESNVISILLALVLALMVWIIATQEANPVETVDFEPTISIEYANLGDNLIITNDPAQTTQVTINAASDTLRLLSASDFTAVADLSDLAPGTHEVPIKVEINPDRQAIFIESNPSRVEVELEEIADRSLPVQLVTNGDPPTGYRAGTTEISPAEVTISGARSLVELASEARVELDIDGMRDTVEEVLTVSVLDSDGQALSNVVVAPPEVQVTVPIVQEADYREVAVRVNASVLTEPGYYVSRTTADPALVGVRGDPDVLQTLSAIETEPIDLQGLKEDTSVVAALSPPDGVTVEDVTTVEVTIAVQAQPGFDVYEVPIQIIGESENLPADILSGNAVVSLSGPLPVLQKLNPEQNIVVSVDVTDLEPGRYQLEPDVNILNPDIPVEDLDEVVVESVLPTLIEVEIADGTEEGAS